jgi:hypothetical protein
MCIGVKPYILYCSFVCSLSVAFAQPVIDCLCRQPYVLEVEGVQCLLLLSPTNRVTAGLHVSSILLWRYNLQSISGVGVGVLGSQTVVAGVKVSGAAAMCCLAGRHASA